MLKLSRRGCLLFKNVLGGRVVLCTALENAVCLQGTLRYGGGERCSTTDFVLCPISRFLFLRSDQLEVF